MKIYSTNPNQMISFVSKNGALGSKQYIWIMLNKYYGRDKASTIMPRSYIFPKDKRIFDKEYSSKKYYMLKSEKQRQSGLEISNNYDKIVSSNNNGFKIVQEYIENPLTYMGYKLNFRVYLLIICNENKMTNGYVFDDGIISYSKSQNTGNINFDTGISSFYTSKDLYKSGYPIIFSELKNKMKKINWDLIYNKFIKLTKDVLQASTGTICKYKLNNNNQTFQIFGIDFMLTKELVPYILEINIGPGMDPFCGRDKKMRLKLHNNMLEIINIIKKISPDNGFIKI